MLEEGTTDGPKGTGAPKGGELAERVETPLPGRCCLIHPLFWLFLLLVLPFACSLPPLPLLLLPRPSIMATPHVIASSSHQSGTSNGVVGNHFRVGKKIGEGSFGVVFEGTFAFTPKASPK